ncbi:type II toxin-antitoxin system RelE/ParE family toxin [Aureimonas endophytica]|nr:type II toxin-antitoxin system RelE/ParE family toxin [Aureimonas endophytica]
MFELRQTASFRKWLIGLRDRQAYRRIVRLERGQFGDAKFFDGLGELRIDHGPGYRVYFMRRGKMLVILLCGGDKSSQGRDIEAARRLASQWESDHGD